MQKRYNGCWRTAPTATLATKTERRRRRSGARTRRLYGCLRNNERNGISTESLARSDPRKEKFMTFDIQRLVEFDFLRATEIAALNCMQWIGKGDKERADAAACDAIRGMFDLMDICGEVV